MIDRNGAATVQRHQPIFLRRLYLGGLSMGLLCCALATQAEPSVVPIRIGFTRGIFKNRNETDVLAALKVWAQTLAEEHQIEVDPDMRIYASAEEAVDAVREKNVDALTLLLSEQSVFPEGLLSGPYFKHAIHGNTHEEYVLLSLKDRNIRKAQDLRGARLSLFDDRSTELATDWLDAQLVRAGLGPSEAVCAGIDVLPKLSATVLSVFFGKSDACLVSREGFDSMAELNPQVAKKLGVFAASPRVLSSVFCFRSDLGEKQKAQFFDTVLRLDETVTGEQVLRVFKSDGMSEITPKEMEHSLALLTEWKTAAAEQRGTLAPE